MYKMIIVPLLSLYGLCCLGGLYANAKHLANEDITLNQVIDRINTQLAPHAESETGIEIEYRTEMYSGWININVVQRICEVTSVHYIENGKIADTTQKVCQNMYASNTHPMENLFQIHCPDKFRPDYHDEALCVDHLKDQLSVELIRSIVKSKVHDFTIR